MPVASCAAGCSVRRRLTALAASRGPDAVAAGLAAELGRCRVALSFSVSAGQHGRGRTVKRCFSFCAVSARSFSREQ